MPISELNFGGITANEVYGTLKAQQINDDDARRFVAGWVWENAYGVGRSFAYSHPLTATDPAAPAPFVRSFAHADWLDGESTVQAGETPTEQGFNLRFHKIEHDLDALGGLTAQIAASDAALRSALTTALDEIRAELNRINADIATLKAGRSAPTVPVGPVKFEPGIKFVGATQYFNKPVEIWQTEDGRMMALPTVNPVTVPQAVVPRAPIAGEVLNRDADIKAVFAAPVKVSDLVEKFGDRRGSDGRPLADLLSALPADASYASPDALVADLADRDALLMRGTGADAAALTNLGVASGKAATVPVEKLDGLTTSMSDALKASNVNTLGDLGNLTTDKVRAALAKKNIAISDSQATALVAKARTLRQF